MVAIDFPHIEKINKSINFIDGHSIKLPNEYTNRSLQNKTVNFYNELINRNESEFYFGTDDLGFDYVSINNFIYVGLLFLPKKISKHKDLKKKYPDNSFSKDLILSLLKKEQKIANFEEVVPIQLVTSNIHEIRNLNAKISGYVDSMLFENGIDDWDIAFDSADENIKKIFVGSRLIKFILDNVRFYRPNAIEELPINKNTSFIIHKSVMKISKILSHDFKKSKIDIELKGKCHKKIKGNKEYFELVIMLLLENAIKYSKEAQRIKPFIEIKEIGKKVQIEFHSWGDLVPIEDRNKLFTSGFRSSIHKNFKEGLGMGLLHARKLLTLYDSNITYSTGVNGNEIVGWNVFKIICEDVE